MEVKMLRFHRWLILGCLLLSALHVFAHQPDQSYLYLSIYQDRIDGTIEMTVKDINTALNLNIDPSPYFKDQNEEISKEALPTEWAQYSTRLHQYLLERVSIAHEGQKLTINFTDIEILKLTRTIYIMCNFELETTDVIPDDLSIDYNVLFDKDDIHRGLTIIAHNWKAGIINNESMSSLIFSPGNTSQTLSLTDTSMWKGFVALVKLGMWHIYIGIDHIFFLLALLLPSVILKRKREERLHITPVPKFSTAFWYILKIITLFTIAHSITLSLAALGFINVESRIVESIIALSIGLAALHNIYPIFSKSESIIAFFFGLFHGLGFASVLGEKGIEGEYLALSLFGFNIGVEIGQVLIVCALFPFLYFFRTKKYYKQILFYGSAFLIIASLYWFVERFFEVDFLLDNYIGKAINKVFTIIGLK